jgi:hypothetical protein
VGNNNVILLNLNIEKRQHQMGNLRFINYRLVELEEAVTSRDVVASWNLALRALQRMRGSRVTWSPNSPVVKQ